MQPEEYERMRALEDWYWWFIARRHAAATFARDWAPRRTPLQILDAGCGTGAMLDRLAAGTDCRVFGLDFSDAALSFTRERGHHLLVGGDLTALPFQDAAFDIITALDVIEHVDDDLAAVQELARVLRPGGVLIATVPAYRFLWGPHDEALHHRRRYGGAEFHRLIQEGGLRVRWLTFLLMLLFPPAALARLLSRGRKTTALLPRVPPALNRMLVALQSLETRIACVAPLPFGLSILVVAERPQTVPVRTLALDEAALSPAPA